MKGETFNKDFGFTDKTAEKIEENEIIRQEHTFQDEEGKDVRVEVEVIKEKLWDDSRARYEGMYGHRLHRYVMRGEKDGQPTTFDLMEESGANDTGDLKIYITRRSFSSFNNELRRAVVPELIDSLGFASFAHEMGHVAQTRDELLLRLMSLYAESDQIGVKKENYVRAQEVMNLLSTIFDLLPGIETTIEEKTRETWSTLTKERTNVLQQFTLLDETPGERKFMSDLPPEVQDQYKNLGDQLNEIDNKIIRLLDEDPTLRDIAALPVRMLERDATARALRLAKKLRDKAGINLISRKNLSTEALQKMWPTSCEEAIKRTKTSAQERELIKQGTIRNVLSAWLQGYDARRMRVKPPSKSM